MPLCLPSRIALFTNVFLACVSFAIVMPSLWPYLQFLRSTKPFLAYVVAIYSIGEALGAISFGSLTTKHSTQTTLLSATLVGAFGSLLYVIAEVTTPGPILVLLARFLQGLWTGGCQAVQQCYLADVLPIHHLTTTTVTLNAYACFGFVVGPAFGVLFNLIPEFPIFGRLHFSELTSPGYVVLFSALFGALLLVLIFDEQRDRAGAEVVYDAMEAGMEQAPLLSNEMHADGMEVTLNSSLGVALLICNIAFFTHFYGFALQETITTPLVQVFYSWNVFSANLLFTFAGLCALAAFLFVGISSSRLSDRLLTLLSLGLGAVGYLLLLCSPDRPLPVGRFLLGFAIISVAFPMGRAVVISLYTKLLPMKMQGAGQGVILAVGAVARIVGPFWAVRAFYMTWGPAIVFGVTASVFALCMASVALYYQNMKTRSSWSECQSTSNSSF